ncbi:MAG: nucleotidyltransferase substrate binding protein [Planctomycetaceae bacterium]|jgi:nucleotidyltransferase substrate binding protein (TIGR01987 family)|nr:nucleotidyltransferase substrate binding protein [Planctomycetaceae bacterium]
MCTDDIRWKQRFSNFIKALTLLGEAVQLQRSRDLSELELHGLIQRFEFTHELAWNLLKDYMEFQGQIFIAGSRDAVREAISRNLIENGNAWKEMISSRNLSSHAYNGEAVYEIAEKIAESYYPLFIALKDKMLFLGG